MTEPLTIYRLPLLKTIKDLGKQSAKLEASIVTTYAFNGAFYEDVLLKSFERAGSRLNVVLADATQLGRAFSNPLTAPRRAGTDYLLVPIVHHGAFHPKIMALLSEKHALLAVGSHNATDAGFGHNEEVSAFWSAKETAPEAVLKSAIEYALYWWRRAGITDANLFEELERKFLKLPKRQAALTSTNIHFIGSLNDQTLWEQMRHRVNGQTQRIYVVGPYFDFSLQFLNELSKALRPREIIVGLQPDTVLLENPGNAPPEVRFVDCASTNAFWSGKKGAGFLHAKLLAIETDTEVYLCFGSANPTGAAWLPRQVWNAEANIFITGDDARRSLNDLGLHNLAASPALGASDLSTIAERSKAVRSRERQQQANEPELPVYIGTPSPEGLFVRRLHAQVGVSIVNAEGQEFPIQLHNTATEDGAIITCDSIELLIGITELKCSTGTLGFLIVNDDQKARASTISRDGRRLLENLGRLDAYDEINFEEVFDLITKHVIAEEPIATPGSSAHSQKQRTRDVEAASSSAPFGKRGISLAQDEQTNKCRRLFEQGLVGELIATLIRSLAAPSNVKTDGDAPDRDEEEISEEETPSGHIAENLSSYQSTNNVDWPRLVNACRKRVGLLINRLKARIEDGRHAHDPVWELGRLLTVMCLIQKLRMLPPTGSVNSLLQKPESLVGLDQLRRLFCLAVRRTYGPGKLAHRLAMEIEANSADERRLLDKLLLWFARELGADCEKAAAFNEDASATLARLQDRADLVVISMSAAANDIREAWIYGRDKQLEVWDDAIIVDRDWFARHVHLGSRLQKAVSDPDSLPVSSLSAGGYAIWSNEKGVPRVVRTATAGKALLIEPGGEGKLDIKVAQSFLTGIDLKVQQPLQTALGN